MITNKPWARVELPADIFHVLPVNDLKDHEDGFSCWCRPRIERQVNGNTLVIHNSADGREFFEPQPVPAGH